MIFERVPIETMPSGGFIYVLHFEGTNYVTLGVGFESATGLQLTHVKGIMVHYAHVHEIADEIHVTGVALPTGKLAPYFLGEPDHIEIAPSEAVLIGRIIEALRKVHDRVWGHPLDWAPQFVNFGDGRLVWLAYGSDIDKIRIGLGFYNEANDPILGDACYTIPKHFVAEFATAAFREPRHLFFYSPPPRFPKGFRRICDFGETQGVMIELVRLADQVWPGGVKAVPPSQHAESGEPQFVQS